MKLTSSEIREKYLKFFESKKHVRISPAPLVLEGDVTTLFTSAGMQPLIPYLKGETHPDGKRLCDSQPSLRLQDIEEVGDNRHTTFFEMLGNWSLGDYFKKEQLGWVLEFFTEGLGLSKEKLWISVFEGTKEVPCDDESYNRWIELGIPKERIHFYGVDKNWWSRSGAPDKMPAGEIGGPDSEIFYDFGTPVHEGCHPNCDCGRFLEIGNSVFIQYEKQKDGSLKELPQKNVDFGGGLERIAMAVNDEPDMFRIDFFASSMGILNKGTKLVVYGNDENEDKSARIILDHLRAAVNIISEGITPSNKQQGYILRRLLRRAAYHLGKFVPEGISGGGLSNVASGFRKLYPLVDKRWDEIAGVIDEEGIKFDKTLREGKKRLVDAIEKKKEINGNLAFDLYQSYGFPLELTLEILSEKGIKFEDKDKRTFEEEFEKHKESSRTASAGMFKGGLAESGEDVTKLHTATHLLHASLRKVLGEHVSQKGSNITAERLRFDFSHPQKLTDDQIKRVEDLINGAIDASLPVSCEIKTLDEAIKEGALHFFAEKYGEKVKVYTVGDPEGEFFSKEVCGGPHVDNTSSIGRVRIIKQEKVGAGVVRIYVTNK